MTTLLKNLAIWLVCTIGAFAAMYLIGSFCVMSLDITIWTSKGGRFGLVFIAGILGSACVSAVEEADRRKALTPYEREKALDLHQKRHSHADY